MRSIFVLLLILTCGLLRAQDMLILKNGDDIKVKVLEVTPSEIKYKKFENSDGPTYTILKADAFMVKYENGTKDIFNSSASELDGPADVPASATQVTAPIISDRVRVIDTIDLHILKERYTAKFIGGGLFLGVGVVSMVASAVMFANRNTGLAPPALLALGFAGQAIGIPLLCIGTRDKNVYQRRKRDL